MIKKLLRAYAPVVAVIAVAWAARTGTPADAVSTPTSQGTGNADDVARDPAVVRFPGVAVWPTGSSGR